MQQHQNNHPAEGSRTGARGAGRVRSQRWLGGVLALGLAFGAGFGARAENLADALTSAYKASGLIEQNRALLRAADEDVASAVAALRPILGWSGEVARDFSKFRSSSTRGNVVDSASSIAQIALTATMTLYDGGSNRLGVDIAKESVLATRQTLASVEQSVLLRAASSYFTVRRAKENLSLRQNNLRLITQELRAARDRFEVGEITRTDVSLAEARLAASRSQLVAAERDYQNAREQYRVAVGHLPGSLASPPPLPKTAKSAAQARKVAVRRHPDILQIQHQVAAADLAVRRAETTMKPTVQLRGQLQLRGEYGNDSFTQGGSVALQANGPIYQGGQLLSVVRKAVAQRDSARSQLHLARMDIEQDAAVAFANLQAARASRAASERQIRAARVAFEGVREEASLGARTTLDVLNAEQELLNARAGRISAVTDEHIAAYSLLAAMGLLNAEHLGLNVPAYDPAAYYNLVKDAPAARSKQGAKLDRVLRSLGKN